MDCASSFVYFKKRKNDSEDDKDEDDQDDGMLSCCSDELNRSFDSDEEDEAPNIQNFMSMDNDTNLNSMTFGMSVKESESEVRLGMAQEKKSVKAKKSKSKGFFSAIGSMFSSKKEGALEKAEDIDNDGRMLAMESCMVERSAAPKKSKKKNNNKERYLRQGRKFKHEIDTNVISLNLHVLKEDAELAAGDPIFCDKCNAVFNVYSKIDNNQPGLEEIKEEVDAEMEDESLQKHEADM